MKLAIRWDMMRWPGWTHSRGDYEIHYDKVFGPIYRVRCFLMTTMGYQVREVPFKEAMQ